MSLEKDIIEITARARKASRTLSHLPRTQKDAALLAIAARLRERAPQLWAENAMDLAQAQKNGLSPAMVDRLTLTKEVVESMAAGLEFVAGLEDPVGSITDSSVRPNGLEIGRMRIPLGVIGIIYESRPNVTVDAAGLCLKSGNAVILRGGSEALNSNLALSKIIAQGLQETGLPTDAIQIIPVRDREAVNILLAQEENVDLIIPRGGEGLIRHVVAHSKIPVLKHYKGVCHIYVDDDADLEKAIPIILNAKAQRPGVCNALETLLIHRELAPTFLPKLSRAMDEAGVTLKGCPDCRKIIEGMEAADKSDWEAEYLDLILAVRIVDDMDQAMDHIADYGSNHTEVILTQDYDRARRFVREVDASLVAVNASTRFNDGGQLGLGAEMGISTSKLHAYGPMGLKELTTTKFVAWGRGQIRD